MEPSQGSTGPARSPSLQQKPSWLFAQALGHICAPAFSESQSGRATRVIASPISLWPADGNQKNWWDLVTKGDYKRGGQLVAEHSDTAVCLGWEFLQSHVVSQMFIFKTFFFFFQVVPT